MNNKNLVVISYYDKRPACFLYELLDSLSYFESGNYFNVLIVVNRTNGQIPAIGQYKFPIEVVERKNIGMNIGAWEFGWRSRPDYTNYLFLQDDCYVIRDNWLGAFIEHTSTRQIGLIAESINFNWDHPWSTLWKMNQFVTMSEHTLPGHNRPINRVDLYLHLLRKWGIEPGLTGKHCRSLILFLPNHALHTINGFQIGKNYGECIASEIAISRAIIASNLEIIQVSENPFTYIKHADWGQNTQAENIPMGIALKIKLTL